MFPLFPFLFGGALLLAWSRAKGNTPPTMTTEQRTVYENAMTSETDPGKLAALADAFAKEGFTAEGKLLQTRSDWYAADSATKAARRDAFRIGMASQDPVAVEKLADAFQEQTATGAADGLRNYAAGLRQGQMAETTVAPQGTAAPDSPLNRLVGAGGLMAPPDTKPALKVSLNKNISKIGIVGPGSPPSGNVSVAAPLPSADAIAQMRAEQAAKNAAAAAKKAAADAKTNPKTPIFRAEKSPL